MNLDNQLSVYIGETKSERMCENVREVDYFLQHSCSYRMTNVEYDAISLFMSQVLSHVDSESGAGGKRRFLYVVDKEHHLHEWEEDQPLPEGWYPLAIIYRNAFSENFGKIARFTLRSVEDPLTINFTRRNSSESLPVYISEKLWAQYIESMDNPNIPSVDIGFVPFDKALESLPTGTPSTYTLRIEEESFQITSCQDLCFCLETLIGHKLSSETTDFFDLLFHHLDSFPCQKVSSPMIPFYTDVRRMVYVGGDGTNGTRRLIYAGKFFPSFFTGASGKVFLVRLGLFEDECVNFVVERN